MKNLLFLLFSAFAPAVFFAQTFKGESVEWDAAGKRWLTSDDGTAIVQRSSIDGSIAYFGSATQAKYGMEAMNGLIWTISGAKIYGYDLQTAEEKAAITIAGASFLNGLASDAATSRLWATDFSAKKIFEINVADLAAPTVSTLVSAFGGTPNGIVFDSKNGRLLVASWGTAAKIKAVSLPDGALTTVVTTALGNIDGIDLDSSGNIFLASWSPNRISKYAPDFSTVSTVTVAGGVSSPADICYALETDTLGVPNTGNGTIKFVGFAQVSATETAENAPFSFKINGNLMDEGSFVEFSLAKKKRVSATVFDEKGQLVERVLASEFFEKGTHRLVLQPLGLAAGAYFLSLEADGKMATRAFFIF